MFRISLSILFQRAINYYLGIVLSKVMTKSPFSAICAFGTRVWDLSIGDVSPIYLRRRCSVIGFTRRHNLFFFLLVCSLLFTVVFSHSSPLFIVDFVSRITTASMHCHKSASTGQTPMTLTLKFTFSPLCFPSNVLMTFVGVAGKHRGVP